MSEVVKANEEMSDEKLKAIAQARFQARVQRVLAVMQEERIDWQGTPQITPDGRIGVRLLPVEVRD